MTNAGFTDISQYRDVESLNHFQILKEKGLREEDAYRILQIHSRDNSRTPMQWNAKPNGGFTEGEPWIEINKNYSKINVQQQLEDDDSIFHYYQKLIRLRKEYDVIAYGDFQPLDEKYSSIFAYERNYKNEKIMVICNFYGMEQTWESKDEITGYICLLGNYQDVKLESKMKLRPYETVVLYKYV